MACEFIHEARNLIDWRGSTSEHLDLTRGPAAARVARAFIQSELHEVIPLDQLDDVLLLTSELVTNVVQHTSSDMHLDVAWNSSGVLVAVQDHSLATAADRASTAAADVLEESGRGMAIVAALADDFGWRRNRETTGKVAWFLMAIAQPVGVDAKEAPATKESLQLQGFPHVGHRLFHAGSRNASGMSVPGWKLDRH